MVEGEGYGGRLMWTNAFESTDPSNWARYQLALAEAGTYEVEYYSTAAYAVYDAVDYEIVHAGETTTLSVDQAGLDGWVTIGTFEFAAGGAQSSPRRAGAATGRTRRGGASAPGSRTAARA